MGKYAIVAALLVSLSNSALARGCRPEGGWNLRDAISARH